jgi:hypothetical protein
MNVIWVKQWACQKCNALLINTQELYFFSKQFNIWKIDFILNTLNG